MFKKIDFSGCILYAIMAHPNVLEFLLNAESVMEALQNSLEKTKEEIEYISRLEDRLRADVIVERVARMAKKFADEIDELRCQQMAKEFAEEIDKFKVKIYEENDQKPGKPVIDRLCEV